MIHIEKRTGNRIDVVEQIGYGVRFHVLGNENKVIGKGTMAGYDLLALFEPEDSNSKPFYVEPQYTPPIKTEPPEKPKNSLDAWL
ncbi:MAG: hypothetical protein CI952_16 [Methanohalophilus sp.]|nr:MAG: hypothetical protein CI952_16 [Methanohalophilus sp.]